MGNLKKELEKALQDLNPPNIAIIGRTGAGKSTLINAVFGKNLAKTGTGFPVSSTFDRYPPPGDEENKSPVVLYDSRGYEADQPDQFIAGIMDFLVEKRNKGVEEQIHLIWYVVHAGLKRFEPFDAKLLQIFREQNTPVIVLLSQADLARPAELEEMEMTLRQYETEYKLEPFNLIKVSAYPLKGEAYGVREVVSKTVDLLPELYSEAFIARQIADLAIKKKTAVTYIKAAAVSCFGSAFMPIPGSTVFVALTAQVTLINRIAALYGYKEWVEVLDKTGTVTIATLLANLLTSVLDIAGSVSTWMTGPLSGAAVNALTGGTAASFIAILGLTYVSVFEKLSEQDFSGSGRQEIEKFIQKTLEREFKKFRRSIKILKPEDIEKLDSQIP